MSWRVALIDSCGHWPGARAAAAFALDGAECGLSVTDVTGHGSRIAALLTQGGPIELLLGQVFQNREPTSAAAVAAALDWSIAEGARLIHLSLGLATDRPALRAAVRSAVEAGTLIVASTPARGSVVYPAAYEGVIEATADARCAPGELSCLAPKRFGGFPGAAAGASPAQPATRGGASVGAAWVSRAILSLPAARPIGEVVAALKARALFHGPERRGAIEATSA